MSGSVVDEAVMRQAREVMVAARRAEHAVLGEVARLESAGWAEATGYKSTERLVQDLWRVDLGEARRLVRQARALCPSVGPSGAAVAPRLAATEPVAAAGVLDRGHVRVIDEAMRYLERLPEIDPGALGEAEGFLAEQARSLSPRGLAKVAARLIAALDQDGVAPEDEAEPSDEVRVGRRRDGSLVLKGRFTGRAEIELILAAFDALSGRAGSDDERGLEARYAAALLEMAGLAMAPGGIGANVAPEDRAEPGETTGPVERGDGDPKNLLPNQRHPDDVAREDRAREARARSARDAGQQNTAGENSSPDESRADETSPEDIAREDAAAEDVSTGDSALEGSAFGGNTVVGGGSVAGDGRVPPSLLSRPRAPGRALLTVSMDFDWLRKQIGHGLVGAEEAISPAEVRRLACDAGIVPMVLGTRSEPLDVGRMSYTVPDAMRRTLVFRDKGCAFPACNRRPERCQAHHVRHWCDGGPTCLANLCLVCPFHHRLIHHGDWQVTMINGRPWFIPPPWIDPARTPMAGGPQI